MRLYQGSWRAWLAVVVAANVVAPEANGKRTALGGRWGSRCSRTAGVLRHHDRLADPVEGDRRPDQFVVAGRPCRDRADLGQHVGVVVGVVGAVGLAADLVGGAAGGGVEDLPHVEDAHAAPGVRDVEVVAVPRDAAGVDRDVLEVRGRRGAGRLHEEDLAVGVGVGGVPVDQGDPAALLGAVAAVLGVPAHQHELVAVVVAAVGGAHGVPARGDALGDALTVGVVAVVEPEAGGQAADGEGRGECLPVVVRVLHHRVHGGGSQRGDQGRVERVELVVVRGEGVVGCGQGRRCRGGGRRRCADECAGDE